jgi:hypothetical protein
MLANLKAVSPPTDAQIEKYERILGLSSVWLLPSLGTLLLFMGVYPIMLAAYAFFKLLSGCCTSVKWLEVWFGDVVFWSWPIKFLNDSFIIIVISCLINIVYASWETKEAAINTGIAYALLIVISLYPAFMQLFLYYRREMLTKKSFLRKFGLAYQGLDAKDNKFLLYPLFSYYRRVAVPITIILFPTTYIS